MKQGKYASLKTEGIFPQRTSLAGAGTPTHNGQIGIPK